MSLALGPTVISLAHCVPFQLKYHSCFSLAAVKLAVDDCTGVVYTHTWLDRGEGSGKGRTTSTSPSSSVLRTSIGDPVVVHGLLKVYKKRQEMVVDSIRISRDPNELLIHTLEAMELTLLQYQQPFRRDSRVTDNDVANALRFHPFPCECDAPYSRSLGYCACHCQLLGKRNTVYLRFMDSLLKVLADWESRLPRTESLHFTFKSLLVDFTLNTVAKEHHLELKSVLRKVLSVLRQDGVVVLRDEMADVYLLASWDRWLCPLLEIVIQELGKGQNTDTIIKFVQNKEPWVTGGRIRACLDAMAASPTGQPSRS